MHPHEKQPLELSPSNEITPITSAPPSSSAGAGPPRIPQPKGTTLRSSPPPFKWSSLWEEPVLNPVNLKSYTLPIFNLRSKYTRSFHLSWLGFFVAFLSWFAFPPLLDEAIKTDLKLTKPQIGNSNIVALSATLIVRFVLGPLVDRYGPRKVMAAVLIVGAIPSGLAGTVTNANGLYVIRFFIGILGGTFVPCLAWTTCFFDTSIVGTANALVGGWGNMGGGVTYVVMTSLYDRLHAGAGLTPHVAWRACYAVVPVPILLLTAAATLIFGQDHPAGRWEDRHLIPATAASVLQGHSPVLDDSERDRIATKKQDKENGSVEVVGVEDEDEGEDAQGGKRNQRTDVVDQHGDQIANEVKVVDVAVNERLTVKTAVLILTSPLTWLPALAYMTTFGFELAVDSNLGAVFLGVHKTLGQLHAGYLASIFGFLNLITRPLGGILADALYRRFGVKAKVYLTLSLGIAQGVLCIGFGQWLVHTASPSLAGMVLFVVAIAFCNEMANGANFALVPHCNSYSNGTMSGLVGAMGNLGGIFAALVWRFHSAKGDAWWINGVIAAGINLGLLFFPHPKA